jgi:hypothetical protein
VGARVATPEGNGVVVKLVDEIDDGDAIYGAGAKVELNDGTEHWYDLGDVEPIEVAP